jgi:hypothetical protein
MKIFPTIFLYLSVFLLNQVTCGQTDKKAILQKCELFFGESLDRELNLFEVNKKFAIHPIFDEKGNLIEIEVEPNYFFEGDHADFGEHKEMAHLTKAEFENLVTKIKSLSPFGMLLGKETSPFITNSTAYSNEYYENVFLKYGEWLEWDKPTEKERVRSIHFYFFREITTKIDKKKHCQFCSGYRFLVKTGEESFYVEKTTYDKLKEGKTSTFKGVLASGVNFETFGTKLKPSNLPSY